MKENAEENRKIQIVKSAISTLSFSEMEAIIHIFDELNGTEGILVASQGRGSGRNHTFCHRQCTAEV